MLRDSNTFNVGHRMAAVLLVLVGTASATPTARTPTITARAVIPGALPTLSYWPFSEHSGDDDPLLHRVDIDARIAPTGCGTSTWTTHPVPGARTEGPFCVAVLAGLDVPLLVVGRPGAAPYILAPGALATAESADGEHIVQFDAPTQPLPTVVDAIRRWATDPGAAR